MLTEIGYIQGVNKGRLANFLVSATGYSKDTVTQALKVLRDLDMITPIIGQRYNGWELTERPRAIFGSYSSPIFQDSPYPRGLLSDIYGSKDDMPEIIDATDSQRSEIIRALHNAGVYGSMVYKIALDPRITLDYVTEIIQENHTSPALLANRMLRGR